MDLIQVDTVSKSFRDKKALDAISFSVKKGEIFGFLGPNGAGKTTTIRCLLDLIRPDTGAITIFDTDVHGNSPQIRERLSYLPADMPLYPNLTGQEHIDFITNIRNIQKDERPSLPDFDFDLSKKVKHLSTGNRQKLGILLTFFMQPELVILDEPTRGLDPLWQNNMHKLFLSYQKAGGTIFLSSHDLQEVEKICHRVGIIKEGKLLNVTSIKSLIGIKMHTVHVVFATPYNKKDFQLPGTEILDASPKQLVLKVSGEVNPVLLQLNRYHVVDLEVKRATLEETFFKYYQ